MKWKFEWREKCGEGSKFGRHGELSFGTDKAHFLLRMWLKFLKSFIIMVIPMLKYLKIISFE